MPEAKKHSITPQAAKAQSGRNREYNLHAQNRLTGLRIEAAEDALPQKEAAALSQGTQQSVVEKLIQFLKAMD